MGVWGGWAQHGGWWAAHCAYRMNGLQGWLLADQGFKAVDFLMLVALSCCAIRPIHRAISASHGGYRHWISLGGVRLLQFSSWPMDCLLKQISIVTTN